MTPPGSAPSPRGPVHLSRPRPLRVIRFVFPSSERDAFCSQGLIGMITHEISFRLARSKRRAQRLLFPPGVGWGEEEEECVPGILLPFLLPTLILCTVPGEGRLWDFGRGGGCPNSNGTPNFNFGNVREIGEGCFFGGRGPTESVQH